MARKLSASPTALALTVVTGLLQQWKVTMENICMRIFSGQQKSWGRGGKSCSPFSQKNSFFSLIGSNLQRAGLNNNNSFYCPSTSGGAPASCCAVSLNVDLWGRRRRRGTSIIPQTTGSLKIHLMNWKNFHRSGLMWKVNPSTSSAYHRLWWHTDLLTRTAISRY